MMDIYFIYKFYKYSYIIFYDLLGISSWQNNFTFSELTLAKDKRTRYLNHILCEQHRKEKKSTENMAGA